MVPPTHDGAAGSGFVVQEAWAPVAMLAGLSPTSSPRLVVLASRERANLLAGWRHRHRTLREES